jgi:hypothetical protein
VRASSGGLDVSAGAADPQAGTEQGSAAIQARLARTQQEAAVRAQGMRTRALGGDGSRCGGRPRFRDGKRAYLRALPQLATAGAQRSALHEVPLSRCWTPEDWAAHRLRQAARAAAHEGGGAAALRAAEAPALVAGSGVALVDSLAPRVGGGCRG